MLEPVSFASFFSLANVSSLYFAYWDAKTLEHKFRSDFFFRILL